MNRKPILITAAMLALSSWPLCAQENAPQPPPQNPLQREDGLRRPEADRPEVSRERDARPQDREDRFRRNGGQMRRPDRGPDQPREDRPDGPPPSMQKDRREGPQADPRGGERGPRFESQGGRPGMDMRPPMMDRGGNRSADRPGDERRAHRSEGVRQRRRGMMDHYGSTPQRGERRDFRSGENEMRAPTPPPHRGPQFDRMSPDRGPDRMERPREMMKPRPEFRPEARGDQGPRSDFHRPPSRDDRGPHREGPPPCGWDGDQRRSN